MADTNPFFMQDWMTLVCPGEGACDQVADRIALRCGHLDQSSSASRFTAGASGFLNLSQSADAPRAIA